MRKSPNRPNTAKNAKSSPSPAWTAVATDAEVKNSVGRDCDTGGSTDWERFGEGDSDMMMAEKLSAPSAFVVLDLSGLRGRC